MYALCVFGALNTQYFVWKLFLCAIYNKNHSFIHNVRAHKRTISLGTIDFRPALTYQSTSTDLRQQKLTSFCVVCGVLFDYKRESTVVSSGVRAVTLVTCICPKSVECLYETFCNQTWYCGAPPCAGM